MVDKRLFIERLADSDVKYISPHELAREIRKLYDGNNIVGMVRLRLACIHGLPSENTILNIEKADKYLLQAAGLSDRVRHASCERSGQLMMPQRTDGPIAQFYQKTVGYNPK
jgi:hypothetical protein